MFENNISIFQNINYNKISIGQQLSEVKTIDRNKILKEKTHDQEAQNKTPLVLTYNRFSPNITHIVQKQLNILNINTTLQRFFQDEPITVFKRYRIRKELIGSNCIENRKLKQAKNTFTIVHSMHPMLQSININHDKRSTLFT